MQRALLPWSFGIFLRMRHESYLGRIVRAHHPATSHSRRYCRLRLSLRLHGRVGLVRAVRVMSRVPSVLLLSVRRHTVIRVTHHCHRPPIHRLLSVKRAGFLRETRAMGPKMFERYTGMLKDFKCVGITHVR